MALTEKMNPGARPQESGCSSIERKLNFFHDPIGLDQYLDNQLVVSDVIPR